MITVDINGSPRTDIELHEGAEFKQDSLHKTASSVTVSIPSTGAVLQECDYIRIAGGSAQQVSVTLDGAYARAGYIEAIVTAAGMPGGTATVSLGVYNDTCAYNAGKIRTLLAENANINAFFIIGGTGAEITLTARTIAEYDATMLIEIENEVSPDYTGFLDAVSTVTNPGLTTVYAGTILGVKQMHMGYAEQDYKVFELDIASNADFLASIYVDMIFPDGATVNMILNGNAATDAWYDESLGEFDGLFDERISPEGFTLGTVDDFSLCTINRQANLWGKTVSDTLDELCAAAGAYWEVTNDKVFNMRYTSNRDTAPLMLDTDATVYDLEVSRDAYTLFSAVRVIGSTTGQGALIEEELDITEEVTSIQLSRPIAKVNNAMYYGVYSANNDFMRPGALYEEAFYEFASLGGFVSRIGISGLHDDNSAYQFLYSFNSNTVYAKAGYSFAGTNVDENGNGWVSKIAYYPVVPIITRLVDTALAAEIAATRGGTGIVEYTLNDNSIASFNKAASVGAAFLANNTKRAKTVNFTTETAGFGVGQLLSGDVPYYGISGIYKVNTVTARVISGAEGGTWRYDIEASTVDYRDALYPLIKGTTFELGTETQYLPMSLSLLGDTDIQTTLLIYTEDPLTWTALEATYDDWADYEATYDDWADVDNATLEVETDMTNAYTATGKALLARALAGGSANINASVQLKLYTASNVLLATVSPLGSALSTADSAINSFYLYEDEGNGAIDHINVIGADGSIIQQITDIGFTKTDSMVLNITKKDEVQ